MQCQVTMIDNQNKTDVLVFGRISEAQAVKALPFSGKRGGEQQLICI